MKAVLLDMYGVIIKQTGDDFVPYVRRTFPHLRSEEILTPWYKADAGELSSLDVWRLLGFRGDLERIEKEYLDTLELNEGFYAFAAEMRQSGRLAVISNDSARWSRYLRDKFDLNRYFDAVSISGELKITKPDERIYRRTLKQLGCDPSECVYVDDREHYLAAAEKLGMRTVLFNSRGVRYDGTAVNSFPSLSALLCGK